MAGRSRLARSAVSYGVRYGPMVFEAVKHGREPAQQAVQAALAKRHARRKAAEHAATLRDGTVLKVIHDGRPVWFVFSADEIVATYPQVPVSTYPDLLRHADLAHRQKPEPPAPIKLPRRLPPLRKG